MDAQQLAQACADAMWMEDEASRGMGMAIESIAPGEAELSMVVRDDGDRLRRYGLLHRRDGATR